MDMKDAGDVLDLLGNILAGLERRAAALPGAGHASYGLAMEQAGRLVRSEAANGNLDLAAYLDIDPADLGQALTDAADRAQAEYERYAIPAPADCEDCQTTAGCRCNEG